MRDAIVEILKSGTGCGVEFAAMLFVHQLEDGRFRVGCEGDHDEWIFHNAEMAAICFLNKRREKGLGFDFETGA
jgi:hypothetical protein